jgi:ABC-type nitrate/sulfonate/bicarbonate transport system substrate-binding protein
MPANDFGRSITRLFVFVGFILVLPVAAAQESRPAEKIRIAYAANNLGFLHMFVANDRGFYRANGLEPELIQVRPPVAIAALVSGSVDYTELFGSTVRAAALGAPIRAVSMAIGAPFFSLAARPQFQSVKDLKGGIVGVSAIGGTNYISTKMLLQHFGLDPDRDVKLLGIGDHKALFEALKIGRVEAVTINPPFSVLLRREGFPLLVNAAKVVSFPFAGLGTTVRKLSENQAQVRKVLKAEAEALRYIRNNAEGTIDLISKRFAIDRPVAAESYQLVVDAFSPEGKISRSGVRQLLELGREDGSITKPVAPEQVANFSLLEEVLK